MALALHVWRQHRLAPLLFRAIRNRDERAVQELLQRGVDSNLRDRAGDPAAVVAARQGSGRILLALLDHGADVTAPGSDGRPAWLVVMEEFSDGLIMSDRPPYAWRSMALLLLQRGAPIDARNERGETPLLLAAAHGSTEVVHLLLAKGADVNTADVGGETPLMWAAANDDVEMVRALLKRGADPRARDRDGHTALMRAEGMGHLAVAWVLRRAGASE
jgi:ankyrin repeat protein